MIRILMLAAILTTTGCAAVPPVVLGAALGFGASALRLDDDLFNTWAAHRAAAAAAKLPASSIPAP